MSMRRDALAGAAECMRVIEERAVTEDGLVATLGELPIPSAASNVIPGRVNFTLAERVSARQGTCPQLVSGAGHDAVALAGVTEVALLFVRCREGRSHHPDEYAAPEDIGLAIDVLTDFLSGFPVA